MAGLEESSGAALSDGFWLYNYSVMLNPKGEVGLVEPILYPFPDVHLLFVYFNKTAYRAAA